MSNFRAWVEITRSGSFLVRHRNPAGKKFTDYCVESKSLANSLKKKVTDEHWRYELGDLDMTLSLQKLLDEFLADCESNNFSVHTVLHYGNSLKRFLADTSLTTIGEIMGSTMNGHKRNYSIRTTLNLWKGRMIEEGLSNNTIRGRLCDVRTWFNWLVANGHIPESPFGKKLIPTSKSPEPKFYTTAEFKALDGSLSALDHHARVACNLAHDAGLREAEALGVRWEDIQWHPQGADLLIRKEISKGKRKSRMVPLTQGILDLLGSRKTGRLVEITLNEFHFLFKKARLAAGINPKLTMHGLRHTFAKNTLQRGFCNLKGLQDLLGHSSIITTQIYAQFEINHFRDVINRSYEQRLVEEKIGENLQGNCRANTREI